MSYKDTLSRMVSGSGLTLREIADRCREIGVPLDPSYISKLQTGKQGPPSDEISRAIAIVCGGEPESLLLESYLEKAPEHIRQLVLGLLDYLKRVTAITFGKLLPKEVTSAVMEHFERLSPFELLNQVSEYLTDELPFSLDREIPDLSLSPNITLPAIDNSMAPLIPQGARANLVVQMDYRDAELVAVVLPDKTHLIRRIVIRNDQIILVPENKQYEVLTYPKDQIKIVGAVKSVTIDL